MAGFVAMTGGARTVSGSDAVLEADPETRTSHPETSAAFVLGWQMAELYRPPGAGRFGGQDDDDLPGLSA
ncbi:MAG TPA: hypothetical protein VG294_00485, partial [Solirubrobacteraceae bacterium]|nr:hypothetical protein [Solirubrobacteraceae bacterium]